MSERELMRLIIRGKIILLWRSNFVFMLLEQRVVSLTPIKDSYRSLFVSILIEFYDEGCSLLNFTLFIYKLIEGQMAILIKEESLLPPFVQKNNIF